MMKCKMSSENMNKEETKFMDFKLPWEHSQPPLVSRQVGDPLSLFKIEYKTALVMLTHSLFLFLLIFAYFIMFFPIGFVPEFFPWPLGFFSESLHVFHVLRVCEHQHICQVFPRPTSPGQERNRDLWGPLSEFLVLLFCFFALLLIY